SRVGAARLPELLSQLEEGLGGLELSGLQRDLAGSDHNCFDALVCSLIARSAALGLTQPPDGGEQADRATREGWIHVPTNPLSHVTDVCRFAADSPRRAQSPARCGPSTAATGHSSRWPRSWCSYRSRSPTRCWRAVSISTTSGRSPMPPRSAWRSSRLRST